MSFLLEMSETVFCEKVHTHARHGLLTSSSKSVEEEAREVTVHQMACHFNLLHFLGQAPGEPEQDVRHPPAHVLS